jgi:hypothetical protein
MLPRKAPSALKTFHELAIGVKDAYESMGSMPVKLDEDSDIWKNMDQEEKIGRKVLFEFMGNLNFVSQYYTTYIMGYIYNALRYSLLFILLLYLSLPITHYNIMICSYLHL